MLVLFSCNKENEIVDVNQFNNCDSLIEFELTDQELFDTDAFHDTVTQNSRITIPAGVSFVEIFAQIEWEADTSETYRSVEIWEDGGLMALTSRSRVQEGADSDTQGVTNLISSGPIPVSEGSYYEIKVYNEAAAPLDIINAATWFAIKVLE